MASKTLTSNKDAMMGKRFSDGFSGWNGKDNHLPIGTTQDGTIKLRSVIAFNVDFSAMKSITSATLRLYHNNSGSNLHCKASTGTNLYISRVTKDWAEGTTDPGEGTIVSTMSYEWDNRYDAFTTTNQVVKSISQQSATNGNNFDIDVTAIVTDWFEGKSNYGFMIRNDYEASGSASYGVQFYSRSASDTSYIPKLIIDYTTNTPPDAPTLTYPINGEIVTSLTPNLSGSSNDTDSGDYSTAVSIGVFGAGNRYIFSTTTTSGDPGSGYFRFNNATLSSATQLYISKKDADNLPVTSSSWESYVTLFSPSSSAYSGYFTRGTITDNGSWLAIPISSWSPVMTKPVDGQSILIRGDKTYNNTNWLSQTYTLDGTPTTFSVTFGASGTVYSPLVGNRYYQWTAATRDKALEWGVSASNACFKVNTKPNSPDLLVTSSPTSDLLTNTPSFSITHSDPDVGDVNMYSYQLIIEKESYAGSGSWSTQYDSGIVDVSGSPVATKSVTCTALPWGGSYRAKALTTDSNGASSLYSPWRYFSTHGTAVATSLFPSSGESGVSLTPTFTAQSGNASDTISSFDLEIRSSDLVSSIIALTGATSTITNGSSVSYKYTGSSILNSTTYKWAIRLTSQYGTSAWSDWTPFTTLSATMPTIVSPAGDNSYTATPSVRATRATGFTNMKYEFYADTASESNPGTALDAVTVGAFASSTDKTVAYSGTALSSNTRYKIRVSVYDTAWSDWAWQSFNTASAGIPTLYSVDSQLYSSGTPWTTDSTPDFTIERSGTDTITHMQVRVYNSASPTNPIWTSSLTSVTPVSNRTTITYSGPTLTKGTTYLWDARYQSGGLLGNYSSQKPFRLNIEPDVPADMYPSNNIAYSTTLLPAFYATFSDADPGDAPSGWYFSVQGYNGGSWTNVASKSILSGLYSTVNSYQWTSSDYTFEYDKQYQWTSYFSDSKLTNGLISSPQLFQFATEPSAYFTTPGTGTSYLSPATVNANVPTFVWNNGGAAQYSFRIDIDEYNSSTGALIAGTRNTTNEVVQSGNSYTFPSPGYFINNKYYKITLTVKNTAGISDSTPDEKYIFINTNAPSAVPSISASSSSLYGVEIEWDQGSLNTGQTFSSYKIQRRIYGESTWTTIGYTYKINDTAYTDYYAGNQVRYQYQVIMVVTIGTNQQAVESVQPDSPVEGYLPIDAWIFVPANRSSEFIQELPVIDESHKRVIQQESFETLGSDRKLIIRGFVLGDEGSITCVWRNEDAESPADKNKLINETIIGRRLLDHLTMNQGPHILKSPFGDVWEVQFEGPEYRWMGGGALEASMNWVETTDNAVGEI